MILDRTEKFAIMDSNEGSGSMQFVLTRKPYTITKQRERWTEEEHNLFLEALKLYGRAWQKIEEHIGTKTAVQIRSHAQKFFTKLEKEAVNKGVPIGQTHDIEIPPPRPKRKPSNPYPRKKSVENPSQGGGKEGKQSLAGAPLRQEKHLLDLEKGPLLEISEGNGMLENIDEGQNHNSEVSDLLQEVQHPSRSLPNENMLNSSKSGNLCTFVEFMPSSRDSINKDETCKSILTSDDSKEHQRLESDRRPSSHDNVDSKMLEFMNQVSPHDKRADNTGGHSKNLGFFQSKEVQSSQSYPRHVPVHILDGSLGMCAANVTSEILHQESICHQTGGYCENLSTSGNPTSPASEYQSHAPKFSINQSSRNFLPIFPPILNQDDYRAYDHVSSTFSSLIVAALMQNPAAHAAAASFGSTLWHCATTEAALGESTMGEGHASQHATPAPSIAAIAGATVAAATAWWAANGLLPFCAPVHAAFNHSATAASTTPMDTSQARAVKSDKGEAIHDAGLLDQQRNPECSEALQEQHSPSSPKSPSVSTSNSEEHEDAKQNAGISPEVETVTQLNDATNLKSRKQVDRSSCGSNTPSSSEVETDALHEKDKEDQEFDINHQSNDSITRRGKIVSNLNDSWKEVSEEGRVAFQALFSRDILPQSFYYRQDLKNKGHKISEDMHPASNDDVRLKSNDQHMTYSHGSNNQLVKDIPPLIGENNKQERLPTLGTVNANLKTRRTGFKPYKRCNTEAKDGRVANCSGIDDEKCPKRIRVEGDATST